MTSKNFNPSTFLSRGTGARSMKDSKAKKEAYADITPMDPLEAIQNYKTEYSTQYSSFRDMVEQLTHTNDATQRAFLESLKKCTSKANMRSFTRHGNCAGRIRNPRSSMERNNEGDDDGLSGVPALLR
ncbi:MAG: hypothetical protein Q3972_00065 [Corynebacterium sp.]|nr:hypothetical protein [Corynebacterium sp.]